MGSEIPTLTDPLEVESRYNFLGRYQCFSNWLVGIMDNMPITWRAQEIDGIQFNEYFWVALCKGTDGRWAVGLGSSELEAKTLAGLKFVRNEKPDFGTPPCHFH
jgi:hypothetical protein